MSKSLAIAEPYQGAQHVAANRGAGNAPVEALAIDVALPTHTRFVKLQQCSSDRPDLQSASKVV